MSFLTHSKELFVQFRKKKKNIVGPYSAFDSMPLAAYRIIDLVLLYKNKNKN